MRKINFLCLLVLGMMIPMTSFAQLVNPVIDLEHHFSLKDMEEKYCQEKYGCSLSEMTAKYQADKAIVMNLGDERIAAMDEAGVDFAQLSFNTPGAEHWDAEYGKKIATMANDTLAKYIAQHPDRIGGFMTLYPEDVEWSVKEIDRCAKMGLYGWLCLSNMHGKRLDDTKYWPIFKKLAELGMPVYLHPEYSEVPEIAEFGYCINGPSFGFTVDALTCFFRMMYRGLFDKYPTLKIILGHDGEGLPFYLNRIDTPYRQGMEKSLSVICNTTHEPSYYVKNNIWLTTSGNFSQEALRCCLDAMPEGHVMTGTDYPYEDFAGSVRFIAENEKLTDAERKAVRGNNAKALGFGQSHIPTSAKQINATTNAKTGTYYNLSGQKVDANASGIVISADGTKTLVK